MAKAGFIRSDAPRAVIGATFIFLGALAGAQAQTSLPKPLSNLEIQARFEGADRAAPVFTRPEGTSWISNAADPLETASINQPKPLGEGIAVWYNLRGRTATGEVYDPNGLTAGHLTLPFGTRVRVVNRENGRSVVVRINDRGPWKPGYLIDLSKESARVLGITGRATVALYAAE